VGALLPLIVSYLKKPATLRMPRHELAHQADALLVLQHLDCDAVRREPPLLALERTVLPDHDLGDLGEHDRKG
jgi:hypothetical protein